MQCGLSLLLFYFSLGVVYLSELVCNKRLLEGIIIAKSNPLCLRFREDIACNDDVNKNGSDANSGQSGAVWKTLSAWQLSLAHSQRSLKSFPIDPITQNFVREVRNALFSKVSPTPFRTPVKLAAFSSDVLSKLLDLDPSVATTTQEFVEYASGGRVAAGTVPLAHRYGGHQFGVWAGQLGDGRALQVGEYVNGRRQRWVLQLKGSGRTPYSRRGDGRAVLRSSVREFLASEAMHYLGIETSRAASLVVSDDKVLRDQFYNGNVRSERCAVVLRLARSWLRIGSLEILTQSGEIPLLRRVVDDLIEHYFTQISLEDADRYQVLFAEVVAATARMIASWQAVGFTHGVGNTDNFSLLSVTIDYGPFGFMDHYDPQMVPNTSDDEARYRYDRQPDVGWFNMDKLRIALLPLLSPNERKQLDTILKGYMPTYNDVYQQLFIRKLGICKGHTNNKEIDTVISLLLHMMAETKADFTMTFRQLGDWPQEKLRENDVPKELWALRTVSKHQLFNHWSKLYWNVIEGSGISEGDRREGMRNVNPRYVLRNWMAQEAVSAAERDDFGPLRRVHRVLSRPYEGQGEAEEAGYADPPPAWASQLRVSCSS